MEIHKLMLAVDAFAAAMKEKLLQKHREGFYGWNEMENFVPIIESILSHAEKMNKPGSLAREEVDIANLAMMIWHLRGKLPQ
jgi:hypothetical protein